MPDPRPHIVIIGAGFGGLSAAKGLAGANVDITLIDQQNHHLFQPLLYQVATAALTPAEIAVPIRAVLRGQKNVSVVMDRVSDVNTETKEVICDSGHAHRYDRLIIATGARHSYFGQEGWEAHAPGLKTLGDAARLREKLLGAFEQAELIARHDPAAARSYLTFVVVGAGPTGVEMAGAIRELASSVLRDFKTIAAGDIRVVLLEAAPRILAGFDDKLSARALRDLESLGVEVQCNRRVTDINATRVETDCGEIEARCCVWAAGVQASPAAQWLGVSAMPSGHVEIDATLRPAGYDDVYVVGDTARLEQEGAALPGIAPVAKQMGQYVARRLAAELAGEGFESSFRYKDAGMLATIGRNRAVADIFGVKVTGFIGWALWGAAHVYFLIGFKNRLFVVLNWLWSYVTWQRGVRLIMDRARE
ncbi:MAG: NAD(P)/FAD-dependent oxidoreductase [Pseudomonadota bacterium]